MANQTKITQLTPEQEAMIPVIRDKWIEIGLRTGPADRMKAEEGVRLAYRRANLEPPTEFIWELSPMAGAVRAAKIENNTETPTREQISQVLNGACFGQHEVSWLSFYDFFKYCGIEIDLVGLSMIAENAGWWWPFEKCAVITERPDEIHLDDQNRLHHTSRMAIRYPDNNGLYVWHGIRVPAKVIESPESLTIDDIKAEQNIEVRRAMQNQMGIGKYLRESGATVVDMDGGINTSNGGAPRVLYRDQFGDQFMCGTDGSTSRVYFMSVPNNVSTCKEAHEQISGITDESLILAES